LHNGFSCFLNFRSLWSAGISYIYRERIIANGNEVCGLTEQSVENLWNVQLWFSTPIFHAINEATWG